MGIDNDLCELGGRIEDAAEELRRAATLALRLCGGDDDDDDSVWPAMATLVDRLDAINKLLTELPGDEIKAAITQAEAYLDDMADRADGISY